MSQSKTPADAKYKRARKLSQATKSDSTPPSPVLEAGESMPAATRDLRLRCVNRDQVTPIPARLEALLSADHLARLIWDALGLLDLAAFYVPIIVVMGGPGQAATDPKILVALWLYAFSQGVNSARKLNDLCVEHLAYIWLCGGVSMNYHTLSDFRVQHALALDNLMTQVLGHLLHAGLVALEHTAQDGMRVRACAGAASFHRLATLEKCLAEARQFLATLPAPDPKETGPVSAQEEAARERAARERVERLEAALAEIPAAQAAKPAGEREARVSTTDPEARVMKMADGGFRPAYNFEFATDTANLVITGVDVTNSGSDKTEMPPMVEQTEERCGRLSKDWLTDGGFVSQAVIEAVFGKVRLLAPVPKPKDKDRDPALPLAGDSPAVAEWRERMATEEAKTTYKLRAATSECVNAQARSSHGLWQLRVRGLVKAFCVALWIAIIHNLLIWLHHLHPVA